MEHFYNEFLDLRAQYPRGTDDAAFKKKLASLRSQAEEEGAHHWVLLFDAKIAFFEKRFRETTRITQRLIELFENHAKPSSLLPLAIAMCARGAALVKLGKFREAIVTWDVLLSRFEGAEEPELVELLAIALSDKGDALLKSCKLDEAIITWNKLLSRFGNTPGLVLKKWIAGALITKGSVLAKQSKLNDAIDTWNELLDRFGDSPELEIKKWVAIAMSNIGAALVCVGRLDDALTMYERVLSKFIEAQEPEFKEWAIRAITNKATVLAKQGKPNDEIVTWNELLDRFGDSPEPEIKEWVAIAMFNKGAALFRVGKLDDALTMYERVLSKFIEEQEPEFKKWAIRAMIAKSDILSKANWMDEASDMMNEASVLLESALELANDDETLRQAIIFRLDTFQGSGDRLFHLIDDITKAFQEEKENYFTEISMRESRINNFLGPDSMFRTDLEGGLFLSLREWNSYTPAIPDQHEVDRGGGYYIRYKDQGIVIDPGYDFIKNFETAGGRMCDIDHIVITHAHNDHTNDFESLLSLFYQYGRKNKTKPKRVHIYLSHGTARKFSGYLPLRNAPFIGIVDILNQGNKHHPQIIHLHGLPGAKLTVLRAYHDDTITLDYSVGLGFEFEFSDNELRRVLFTGDTGVFPPLRNSYGEIVKNEDGTPKLNLDPKCAIYNQYPDQFKRPHILIPHIGSIKQAEFTADHSIVSSGGSGRNEILNPYFYPNHLGLRGSILMLNKLRPSIAILSEFGEELKSIRFDLVRRISKFLEGRLGDANEHTFVIPGDLPVICEISRGQFFCPDKMQYLPSSDIEFKEETDPVDSPYFCNGTKRAYTFSKPAPPDTDILVSAYFKYVKKYRAYPYCDNWNVKHR